MAGYSDTRQLIIDTLVGRPPGTEIQPEDHQAFALALNDYIRSVELVAGSGVPVAFAEPNTVPVQPDNGQAVYLSQVPQGTTKTFSNFIGQDGNALSVSSENDEVKMVTLLWNGSYWSSQIVTINRIRGILSEEITYEDLVELRNEGELNAGAFYRITDYVTTTSSVNTQSAGHPFDVIVFALTNDTLSERAWACHHDGDTYFQNSHLEAWQIWYCLDNDASRFAWAVPTTSGGKGVIYRMIDEYNNECPYDFKNILFPYTYDNDSYQVYTFCYSVTQGDGTLLFKDSSLGKRCYHNVIKSFIASDVMKLPFNLFVNNTINDYTAYNFLDVGCYANIFGKGALRNNLGYNCARNVIGENFVRNTLLQQCSDNYFGNNYSDNYFESRCVNFQMEWVHFVSNNHFETGCVQGISSNETASSNFKLQNFRVSLLTSAGRVYLHRDNKYQTYVSQNSIGEVKVYNLADIIL